LHHHDGGECSHGGHSHGDENDHLEHDHSQHDHSQHDHSQHDHSQHDHSQHDHGQHDHSQHDHSQHDHSQHDHSQHEHGHNHEHGHSHTISNGHSHDHEHNVPEKSHGHDHDQGHNANVTGFFLHILADALGSVGVIISSLLIHYKGMYIADPICSVIISIMIFGSTIPLLYSSGGTLLLQSPGTDKSDRIRSKVEELDEVYKVKTLNLWEIESGAEVCSIHVVVRKDTNSNAVNEKIKQVIKVDNTTIQLVYLS
jgi:zinc transporter 5/7